MVLVKIQIQIAKYSALLTGSTPRVGHWRRGRGRRLVSPSLQPSCLIDILSVTIFIEVIHYSESLLNQYFPQFLLNFV